MAPMFLLVPLLVLLRPTFARALSCPEGSVFHSGFCFRPENNSLSYKDAENACEQLGGTLAIFRSRATQRAVFYWMKEHDLAMYGRAFWMGLKYDYLSGQHTWQFVDETYLTPWDFQDWAEQHVTEHHNLCGLITSGKWLADVCDGVHHPYMCQIPAQYCKLEDIILPNGYVSECREDGEYLFDESLTVRCLEGFILRGSETITCQQNGTWSTPSSCQDGCKESPEVQFASVMESAGDWFSIDEEVQLSCDDGYYMFVNDLPKSLFSVRCTGGNHWRGHGAACLPLEAMHFSYSPHPVATVAVLVGKDTSLPCHTSDEELGDDAENRTTGVWLKDQRDVTSITDTLTRFDIGPDSSLNIHDFGEDGSGLYVCLAEGTGPGDQKSVQVRAYRVVTEEVDCKVSFVVTPTDVVKNEKEHALLRCFAPRTLNVWFKDGIRVQPDERRRTLPDGALLLESVTYDDQGFYTCVALDKDTGCSGNASAKLFVAARAQSLCGRSDNARFAEDSTLLYGNETYHIESFPWLATLWLGAEQYPFCYGALVSDLWVLTSTTCVYGIHKYRIPNLMVVLGAENVEEARISLTASSAGDTTAFPDVSSHTVDTIITHPHYIWSTTDNDVALLKLSTVVRFSPRIRPICLPPPYLFQPHPCEQVSASAGLLSGWGPIPPELRPTYPLGLYSEQLKVENPAQCQLSVNFRLPPALFCARDNDSSSVDDSFGRFAGDSGAPFQVWHGKRWYLFGIFTRGERASHDGSYDYFTRIDAHQKWWSSYIQPNTDLK